MSASSDKLRMEMLDWKRSMAKQCSARMFIDKFLSNSDVCFRFFFPFPNGIVWYNEVAFDPSESRVMRSITLNKELFEKVTTFKIFFTLQKTTTFRELIRAVTADRGYDSNNNKSWYNHFGVRYSLVSNDKLDHIWHLSPRQQSVQNMERPYGKCSGGKSRELLTAECVENRTRISFGRQSTDVNRPERRRAENAVKLRLEDKGEEEGMEANFSRVQQVVQQHQPHVPMRVWLQQLMSVGLVTIWPSTKWFLLCRPWNTTTTPKWTLRTSFSSSFAILSTGFGFALLHLPTLSMGQNQERRRLLRLWIHKRHPWWRREARHRPGKGLRQTHCRTGDSKEES